MKKHLLAILVLTVLLFLPGCDEEEVDIVCTGGQLYELYTKDLRVCDFVRIINLELIRANYEDKRNVLYSLYSMKAYLRMPDLTYDEFVIESAKLIRELSKRIGRQAIIMDYDLFGIHLDLKITNCDKTLLSGLIDKLTKDISNRPEVKL